MPSRADRECPRQQDNMATFIFDNDLARRIKHVTANHAKTAREIAKELGEDKHVINQHLYKMAGERGEVHRVPTWWFPPEKEDDWLPVTYNGSIIGYSKPGELGIHTSK